MPFGSLKTLRFFLVLKISKAFLSNDGATTHSRKMSLRIIAASSSTLVLKATMPPKALTESQFNAFLKASDAELLIEAPQGLLCFKILLLLILFQS